MTTTQHGPFLSTHTNTSLSHFQILNFSLLVYLFFHVFRFFLCLINYLLCWAFSSLLFFFYLFLCLCKCEINIWIIDGRDRTKHREKVRTDEQTTGLTYHMLTTTKRQLAVPFEAKI